MREQYRRAYGCLTGPRDWDSRFGNRCRNNRVQVSLCLIITQKAFESHSRVVYVIALLSAANKIDDYIVEK